MREAVIDRLILELPGVGVYESGAAAADAEKPFVVVRLGAEQTDPTWNTLTQLIDVGIYHDETTFMDVDTIRKKVIAALDEMKLVADDGSQWLVEHAGGTDQDVQDERYRAFVRVVRFRGMRLGFVSSETYDPDPAKAMREFVENLFPELHTDPDAWSPTNEAPGVYWRVMRLSSDAPMNWGAWFDVEIAGFVVSPGGAARRTWARRITERIALTKRIRMSDGGPLIFQSVRLDTEGDSMRQGQIVLRARYGVLDLRTAPPDTGALLERARVNQGQPEYTEVTA